MSPGALRAPSMTAKALLVGATIIMTVSPALAGDMPSFGPTSSAGEPRSLLPPPMLGIPVSPTGANAPPIGASFAPPPATPAVAPQTAAAPPPPPDIWPLSPSAAPPSQPIEQKLPQETIGTERPAANAENTAPQPVPPPPADLMLPPAGSMLVRLEQWADRRYAAKLSSVRITAGIATPKDQVKSAPTAPAAPPAEPIVIALGYSGAPEVRGLRARLYVDAREALFAIGEVLPGGRRVSAIDRAGVTVTQPGKVTKLVRWGDRL